MSRMTTDRPPEPAAMLRLTDIHKSFHVGTPVETEVLHGIHLCLQAGEFVALKGPSGAGKSTLLNIVGLLEPATSGTLEIAGQALHSLDDEAITALRGSTIGFVFQFHHLLPAFTALENVLLPSIIAHGTATDEDEATQRGPVRCRNASAMPAIGSSSASKESSAACSRRS